jgi:hypothetical protein
MHSDQWNTELISQPKTETACIHSRVLFLLRDTLLSHSHSIRHSRHTPPFGPASQVR